MLSFSSSFPPTCFLASRTIFLPLDSRFSASPFAYRSATSSPLLNHAGLIIIIINFYHSDAAATILPPSFFFLCVILLLLIYLFSLLGEFNYAPILESVVVEVGTADMSLNVLVLRT